MLPALVCLPPGLAAAGAWQAQLDFRSHVREARGAKQAARLNSIDLLSNSRPVGFAYERCLTLARTLVAVNGLGTKADRILSSSAIFSDSFNRTAPSAVTAPKDVSRCNAHRLTKYAPAWA